MTISGKNEISPPDLEAASCAYADDIKKSMWCLVIWFPRDMGAALPDSIRQRD